MMIGVDRSECINSTIDAQFEEYYFLAFNDDMCLLVTKRLNLFQ